MGPVAISNHLYRFSKGTRFASESHPRSSELNLTKFLGSPSFGKVKRATVTPLAFQPPHDVASTACGEAGTAVTAGLRSGTTRTRSRRGLSGSVCVSAEFCTESVPMQTNEGEVEEESSSKVEQEDFVMEGHGKTPPPGEESKQ
ncbi:hypothetical protein HispidOSU_026300 [Sigmodon hispidus]